ncbi:MAG: hypothetical protein R6V40_01510, partial [Candidatus Moraniibacteriota bacterium]
MATEYKRSKKWIREQLDEHTVKRQPIKPCSIIAVSDMSFIKKAFGVAVIRDPHLKKNLLWKFSKTENISVYRELRRDLEEQGFEIQAAVVDGKRGLVETFADIPVQMCQFHQIQIMTRYLTTRPKLVAGQTLRHIALCLPKSNEKEMREVLDEWHGKWKDFLSEKTYNPETKRWHYTHKRLRSAFRSITNNLPILYTYQKYPELNIPNTTNCLDGTFSHLKDMLRIHRGLKKNR